jgi:hypothetical protein
MKLGYFDCCKIHARLERSRSKGVAAEPAATTGRLSS